ncbi:MAG: LysR family transcriptional regulator [Myxococcota bacterium]
MDANLQRTRAPVPTPVVAEALVWDDVKVFLALWRERSYKAAGARLGVVGSTVGRRLDALEAALGARLFDRTPDGVLPTAAAESLVPHAERFEQAALGLGSAVAGLETAVEGVVRLTAPPGIMDVFVVPRMPTLLARHPGLRLELDGSVGYADLTRREADLALRATRPSSGDLVAVKIASEPDTLFAAPELARKARRWKTLAGAPVIAWGQDLAHIPSARWLAAAAPEATVVLRTSQIGAQIAAAKAGLGLVVLPHAYGAETGLAAVRLAPALLGALPEAPLQHLWLVGHRALREVPRVAAVWSFLQEAFGA